MVKNDAADTANQSGTMDDKLGTPPQSGKSSLLLRSKLGTPPQSAKSRLLLRSKLGTPPQSAKSRRVLPHFRTVQGLECVSPRRLARLPSF
ncbi:GL24140 [Drosophila persimilis]|uniref:GL24140 n=1 Tax=Drosophila persimilis TaxID=7234 RepID=B4G410_DROPE|nr:GL24140 [Drosophila persimilis]